MNQSRDVRAAVLAGLLGAVNSSAMAQAPDAADPKQSAVVLAGAGFVEVCLLRLSAVASATDYAAGSSEIGRMKMKDPAMAALPVTIEGVDGQTCRVTYSGPYVDRLWTALADFKISKMNAACVEAQRSATRASLSCAANKTDPAYEEVLARAGDGAEGRLSASITYRGPHLP